MNRPILGCIADDLTGATDLGNNLVRAGMRVILTIDVPATTDRLDADAIVVALKSRTIPAAQAVAQSLHACRWLGGQGVRQIYFKICSTFDSTPRGNIGPVIEALMDELGVAFSCVIPAFPDNQRTVYMGHLFVGSVLLSESGMRHHPLNPMTDANLVRFLQRQLSDAGGRNTALLEHRSVAASAESVRRRIDALRAAGASIAIADTLDNSDLARLAAALRDEPLITAGSGMGLTLPAQWGFDASNRADALPPARGLQAIVSGSCSTATNAQVQHFIQTGGAACFLDPVRLAQDGETQVEEILRWADACWSRDAAQPVLVYSTAPPAAVQSSHERLGVERSGALVESALSVIARALVARGVGQLVVAGGETAGVCVRALDIGQMRIGPQIVPGVPWCAAPLAGGAADFVHVALKSGNFGTEDFFTRAFSLLH